MTIAGTDLRDRIASALLERSDAIAADTSSLVESSADDHLDAEGGRQLTVLLLQLLAALVRDGRVNPAAAAVAAVTQFVSERAIPVPRLFAIANLVEQTALDELAVDPALGATTEHWGLVTQTIRRASFDMLASCVLRTGSDLADAPIVDRLTTVFSRAMLDTVLTKELDRAGRSGGTVSLVLFDVDGLAAINRDHGYGTGNSILERLGALMRTYFRQHDWVARHGDDSIAVLLTETTPDSAADVADRVRSTVEQRFGFVDHRSGRRVPVTVSGAVINVTVPAGEAVDRERLLAEAEAAVARAKQRGRNRIERVDR